MCGWAGIGKASAASSSTWAQQQSSGRLWLYTFARNRVAQAFYEHHGFRIVARGFEPTWQLDDIKYEWLSHRPTPPDHTA